MTATQIHDSTSCTAGVNGGKCEMCHFVEEFEKTGSKSPSEVAGPENQPAGFLESGAKNVSDSQQTQNTAISAPDFTREWDTAPRARQVRVEQEDALWWFMRGVRAGELSQMIEENRLFRSMAEQRGLKP